MRPQYNYCLVVDYFELPPSVPEEVALSALEEYHLKI